MPVDTARLLWIVTGVQLNAELGDRPLAYRVETGIKQLLSTSLLAASAGEMPLLAPVVVSDVYYLNNAEAQDRGSGRFTRWPVRGVCDGSGRST